MSNPVKQTGVIIMPDKSPQKIEILRACLVHGVPRAVGDIVELERSDALLLKAMSRARLVD